MSYPRAGFVYDPEAATPRVDAVSSATPYAMHDVPPKLAGLTAKQRKGERVYRTNCAFCHGADGSGMNWIGMGKTTFDQNLGTDIVAGDDAHGLLWILDPTQGYDDHPLDTYPDGIAIDRVVTGQVPVRMRDTIDCGGVYLTFATGEPALVAAYFKLETSDDQARSWTDHGTVTVNPSDWAQQVQWLSLGQIVSPGRIFRITDNGATVRIDGLDMLDPL